MAQSVSSQMQTVPAKAPVGVTLMAVASLEPTALVVTYRVVNATAGAIVVWDRMLDYDDKGEKIDPDGAYVFWEKPEGVRLVRAELRLPPGMDVYQKEVPYARTVAAHGTAEGTVRLALPLHEASPFYALPDLWDVVACKTVRLVVGWRELEPEMKVVPVTVRGVKVESVRGRWAAPAQHLLETSLDVATKLKVYREEFDRSMPMR